MTDAHRAQAGADPADLLAQLAPGDLGVLAQLGRGVDRDRVVVAVGEQVLGVREPHVGEPARARHRVRREHPRGIAVGPDRVAVPERPPELRDVRDRPAPQRVVVRRPDVARERRHLGALVHLRRWAPEPLRDGLGHAVTDDGSAASAASGTGTTRPVSKSKSWPAVEHQKSGCRSSHENASR